MEEEDLKNLQALEIDWREKGKIHWFNFQGNLIAAFYTVYGIFELKRTVGIVQVKCLFLQILVITYGV